MTKPVQWRGMNRKITPAYPDTTLAEYQQNLRMKVDGEIQRRNGFASSNVAKQSTPIYGMYPIGAANGAGVIITPGGGSVIGNNGPQPQWGDVAIAKPIAVKVVPGCTPTQTVIVSLTWANSGTPTGGVNAYTLLPPGTGCCYDVSMTMVNSLTLNSGTPHAPVTLQMIGNNTGLQTARLNCAGLAGNFMALSQSGDIAAPIAVTGILTTNHWFDLTGIMNLFSSGNWTGTSTITVSIVPNHACNGC